MIFGKKKSNDKNVIRFEDKDRGLVLYRYGSDPGDLPLLRNTRIFVGEGQHIVFICGNTLADVWDWGEYRLIPDEFPLLAEKKAFPAKSGKPVNASLYYVSTDPITERKWATKTPALVREAEQIYRVRAYGTYDYRVKDPIGFMLEAFMNRGLKNSYEVMGALSTLLAGAFTATASEMGIPVLELINHPREISDLVRKKANLQADLMGVEFLNVLIEGTSLPD